MQKLQDSVFSIVKTTNLSPAVFSFLQPTEEFDDKTPLGGILNDTRHGWLALGPKFCVIDLRTGLKVAARNFGALISNTPISVSSVVELPTPLIENTHQLVISLQCDKTSIICVLHVNNSQLLRCIQTEVVVTQLAVCDVSPDGPLTCLDGVIMAGTKSGEIFVFDLMRSSLIRALKDISQGYEHLVQNESYPSDLSFIPLSTLHQVEEQRELALENDCHLAILLNESSLVDNQYIFRNPDGTVRMKAKRDHICVTVLQYIPQLGSLAIGYNFGAFQLWNLMNLNLEYTSQVNVECLPVTHFGFQEPCDDPRAFCYLWVVFSVIDRFEEEEFPLAVMYSLTYQGKRMLSDTKYLYQEFSMANIRFQIELASFDDNSLIAGKCVSCHTYSINSTLGADGEDSMLNICQLVWECWGENANTPITNNLLFDLDQWYKDQMPATQRLENNAFMSTSVISGAGSALDVRLCPTSLTLYSHATRLEEHFYPASLQYNCICLNTSEIYVVGTVGIQRQMISSIDSVGPTALLLPTRLYSACVTAGLAPLYSQAHAHTQEDQRRFLLSVALEARLSHFLKRCAHDWATGSHSGVGCTLTFLVDWCWKRAIELKENAKELTAPLFVSSALPDRNVIRCLENCVQQFTQLTSLMDSILTKCCNLVVPDALSEMEDKHKGIGCVSTYFQVVQWLVRVSLLPARPPAAPPYPAHLLPQTYAKRRIKLNRLLDDATSDDNGATKSCSLLYIDQLIENEFGGERIHKIWLKDGSDWNGLYPPPSLYSLLRIYLLPDIAEEHKHSLVLYLLLDYSMLYDDIRYEPVIRRLMQFPAMFGLSNTAIKATQAFWHLDHRDFDFALDQLQCLTGNTLSEWQHHVVLSSLLAQKKTQAALQYLHVRKPPPIHSKDNHLSKVNDHDKLEDWQSCCNLYLARGLVCEALDVVRMCVQNSSGGDKEKVLNFFYKGCRNTGHLSKLLQVNLLPFEEEVFIKYLEQCNETQTSDILIMYYLQQARYLEADNYNKSLRNKLRRDTNTSSVQEENVRDILVEVMCTTLPDIARSIQYIARENITYDQVFAPKPMSVFIQAQSPKNTFTYKSSFIQNTIANASETWARRGVKRTRRIEDTPFLCTPKLARTKGTVIEERSEATPSKRGRVGVSSTPRRGRAGPTPLQAALLHMPDLRSPDAHYSRPDTPHSILKIRREAAEREASPTDSRYLPDSDDDALETASYHTHCSDSTNKHLRFVIPYTDETLSPEAETANKQIEMKDGSPVAVKGKEMNVSTDSFVTTTSHAINETHPLESPPKRQATEDNIKSRKSLKDNVKARRSFSTSINSSLSDDPNTSIESIADIPITLINPRYSRQGSAQRQPSVERIDPLMETQDTNNASAKERDTVIQVPKTPQGRRGIRSIGESTPLANRNRSVTPERQDSPIVTPLCSRVTRSRSRTPEPGSPLAPIAELPALESCTPPHPAASPLTITRPLRSPRTPERFDKPIKGSPRLEAIAESPTKSSNTESSSSSPSRPGLRSRSRTPEVEVPSEQVIAKPSPRSLRSRSTPPEKILTPRKETKSKKTLSRLVLEANTFSKLIADKNEQDENKSEKSENESTPMKTLKQVSNLLDVTLSPIVNKSVLQSSIEDSSMETDKELTPDKTTPNQGLKSFPAFTTIHESYNEKSVLVSYESSVAESSQSFGGDKTKFESTSFLKPLPSFTTVQDLDRYKSVLYGRESSVAEISMEIKETNTKTNTSQPFGPFTATINSDYEQSVLQSHESSVASDDMSAKKANNSSLITNDSDVEMKDCQGLDNQETAKVIQKEKEQIVEIEREINEIEGDMSDDGKVSESSGDEEILMGAVQEESSSEQTSTSSSSSTSGSDSDNDDDDEIISINDTDTEHSSDKLVIVERTEAQSQETGNIEVNIKQIDEDKNLANINIDTVDTPDQAQISRPTDDNTVSTVNNERTIDDKNVGNSNEGKFNIEKETEDKNVDNTNEGSVDPLNQAQVSLLTDDNSDRESDKSDVNLNYSEELVVETHENDKQKIEHAVEISVIVEEAETENIPVSEDVVDETPRDADEDAPKKPTRTRKRAKSTSSHKSTEPDTEIIEEPKTPMTRKRSQSNASNKSVTETETRSRRRSQTPTDSGVRKIITRRMSKELSEIMEQSLEESPATTPKRRSARSKSKTIEHDESVASTSLGQSTRSMETPTDSKIKAAQRISKKYTPAAKIDLEVIHESLEKEMHEKNNPELLEDNLCTISRSPSPGRGVRRAEPAAPAAPATPAALRQTEDPEGAPDTVEPLTESPDSVASDASSQRRARVGRAASETKAVSKPPLRSLRRMSVDIRETPERSPGPSPARGRRASFTRACEALHTPKGRRVSTDLRPIDEGAQSPALQEEPSSVTPGRRPRRASTQSNSSLSNADTGKRTKKSSKLEENKDTKNK